MANGISSTSCIFQISTNGTIGLHTLRWWPETPRKKLWGVSGEFWNLCLWANFDRLEDVPATIAHRISVKIGDYPDELTVVTPAIAVDRDPVAVIASPLVGDNFVAANGPSNSSAHRVTVIPVN